MSESATQWLIQQVIAGDEAAWEDLINLYEGRLGAFVRARLRDPHTVEDVVQETLMGFLRSLPNFDPQRNLESYLFTIAAHKIRDHLRKSGRHPLRLLDDLASDDSQPAAEPAAGIRGPSSLVASAERLAGEEERLVSALEAILDQWRASGDYHRIKCIELLLVAGWANKDVAKYLDMSEQQVANYKFQLIERLANRT